METNKQDTLNQSKCVAYKKYMYITASQGDMYLQPEGAVKFMSKPVSRKTNYTKSKRIKSYLSTVLYAGNYANNGDQEYQE